MEISPEWILGVLLGLAGVIASLAGIIFKLMTARLAIQDRIIEQLQNDVERLSQGCGVPECLWKDR
jgi:hypothetical protein